MIEDAKLRVSGHAVPKRAGNLAPGGIARVENAPHAVRGFPPQRRPSVGVAIELGAPGDELAHVAWPLADEHLH